MNKVKVKESKIHGLGLFADQEFNEGDMIGLAHYNGVPSEIIGKYVFIGCRLCQCGFAAHFKISLQHPGGYS